jgi:hypothetical protein
MAGLRTGRPGRLLTLDSNGLAPLASHFPAGLRRNPVIYDPAAQTALINGILTQGNGLHAAGNPAAIDATVGALIFVTPLVKNPGFAEEREWRLIYTPLEEAPPHLGFHPRRDFLAPVVSLQHLWVNVRHRLLAVPGLPITPPPMNVAVRPETR